MQIHTEHNKTLVTGEAPGRAVFGEASFGFMPVFMDVHTHETHVASYRDGQLAVVHVLDGLPYKWIDEWGSDGRPVSLKAGVIAGFMRGGVFYTLSDIMNGLCDA